MNYFGKFDAKVFDALGHQPGDHLVSKTVHATHVPSDAIVVPDVQLLFGAEFKRAGVDLVLSGHGREYVVHDYFKGEKHAPLASPDGAHLTGDLVNALAGQVQYAQADGTTSAHQIIGHVTKLVGTATAIRNGVSIILNNGDNVEKGDVVASGSDSTLGITFIDGTVFGLSANARMVLNEMVYDPNGSNNSSLLSLVAGTITFVAGETAKHGDMKIDTPVATMGIRGTAVLFAIHFKLPNGSLVPDDVPPPPDAVPEGACQVLVEPDGTVGSLIMFEKSTLTPLAVVDKAGVQINITSGNVFQTTSPLSPEIQKLITDVFSLKFSDSSTTKSIDHFTDSIIPTPFGAVKFVLVNSNLPTFTVTNTAAPTGAGPQGNGANISHIAQAPNFTSIDPGTTAELPITTGSSALDIAKGSLNYFDVNVHDNATVSVSFASFTYTQKQPSGQVVDITSKLNALELADIKAVSDLNAHKDLLTIVQGSLDAKGDGTAQYTYHVADGAFDFLAKGETLTLTFVATVDNNYVPADQTGSATFTITITGTNDAPVITGPQQNITFAPAGHDTSGGNLFPDTATNGTLVFADPDLTDTHTASVVMTSALLNGVPLSEIVGADRYKAFADALTVKITTADDSTGTGTGQVEWTLADLEVYLADLVPDGEKLILTYTVTVTDSSNDPNSTATQSIVVTIEGNQPAVTAWIDINPIPEGGAALWSDAANWESDKAPTKTDDVFIGNDQVNPKTATFPVTVDAGAQAQSLSMDDFSDGIGHPTLHVNAGVTLAISGALNLNTSKATDPSTGNPLILPTAEAIIDNYGTITVGGAAELLKSSVLNNYGTLVLSGGGDFADQSSITNSGTIELKGGTLSVEVDITNSGGTIQVDKANGLELNGSAINGGTIAGSGTVDVTANSSIKGTTSVFAVVDVSGVTVETGKTLTLDNVTVNGTTVTDMGTGAVVIADVVKLEGSAAIEGTSTSALGTITNNGTLEVAGAASLIDDTLTNNGTIQVDGGQTLTLSGTEIIGGIVNDFSSTTGGTIDVTGDSKIDGNATLNKGSVTVETGKTLTLDNVTVNGTTVTDMGTGAVVIADVVKLEGNAAIEGTSISALGTITNNGTLEVAGAASLIDDTLTNNGTIQVDGGQTLTLSGTEIIGGIVNDFSATTGGTIDVTGDSKIDGNATLNKGSVTVETGKTLTLDNVTVNGTTVTDMGTGAVVIADVVKLEGNAAIEGTSTSALGTITNNGTLEVAGAASLIDDTLTNNGTIQVDGGQTLTLSGTEIIGGIINDFSATTGGTIDVTGDSKIDGNATLNKGSVTVETGKTLTLNTVTLDGVTLSGGTDAATAVTVGVDSTIKNATVTGDITTDPAVTLTLNTVTLDGVILSGGTDAATAVTVGADSTIKNATVTGDITTDPAVTLTLNTVTLDGVILSGGKINDVGSIAGFGTIGSVITGSGTLTASGGTLTLTGDDTYSGVTTITGTLALTGAGSIADSSGVVDNGTFDISGLASGTSIKTLSGNSTGKVILGGNTLTLTAAAGIFSGVISGSGGLTVDGTATETLTGINTFGGATTIGSGETLALSGAGSIAASSGVTDDGTFDISATASGASIVTLSGNSAGKVHLGGKTLTLTNANDSFSGVIDGTGGGLVLTAGTETLTGANTYTGATTITGTLVLSGTGSIADSSGVVDNGTFDISGLTTGGTSITTLSGNSTGKVILGSNTLTLTAGAGIFAGVISGSSGGLTVDGTGTETLSGVNTYTGATTIGSGETLALSGNGSIANSSGVADNGTFDIQATSGASIVTLSGTGTVTLGSETLTLSNASTEFDGAIDGSGGLTLTKGTETLGGNNLYTGVTTINGGTLALSGNGSISASSGVADNGTFDISTTTLGASIVTLSGNSTGKVHLGGKTLTLTNANDTFSGVIDGAGGGLTLTAGTETLTGTNTYTGVTTINGGTLALSGTGSIATSSGVSDNGTFDISGLTSGTSIKTLSGNSTGKVNLGANSLTLTAGAGIFAGVISGSSGGLTVDGTGTETLTGINTYTGATTIGSGETLALSGSGSIAKSSGVTDNGTFDISATSGASIVTLSGNSTGKVNLGANTLTLTAGAGTFAGVISGNSGGLTVDGTGTETLTGVNTYTGATTIGSGETLALSGSGSIAKSSGVADNGTFDIHATSGASIVTLSGNGALKLGNETLTLTNASTEFDGTISSTGGGITVASGTLALGTMTLDDLTLAGSFSNAGTLTVDDTVTFNGVTMSGGTLDVSGTLDSIGTTTISGASIINPGHIVQVSGTLTIDPTPFTNTGMFEVQSSAVFSGEVHTDSLGHVTSIDQEVVTNTGGTIQIDAGGTLTLFDTTINGGTIIDNGTLLLTGTTSKLENVALDISSGTKLELGGSDFSGVTVNFGTPGPHGNVVSTSGLLILDDSHHFAGTIEGLVENSDESLENHVDLTDLSYDPLQHQHVSAVYSNGEVTVTVTDRHGNILGTAVELHVSGPTSGSFETSSDGNGGVLLDDPATTGNVTINSDQTLSISAASSNAVTFTNNSGTTGELLLADSKDFTGTITGFAGDGTVENSDLIDVTDVQIADVATSKTTYTDHGNGTGTLTLYDAQGQALDSINFNGNYQLANFTIESDGTGGTLIVDPPVNTTSQTNLIVATAPNETLSGTASSDNFVFNFANVGQSKIANFHPATDTLQFGSSIFANAQAALNAVHDDGHGNSIVTVDAHDSITLTGVLKAQLHAGDFHIV